MTIAKFQGGDAVTMSSRELAELTGKRHDNVLADIRGMLSDLEIDALTFQEIYLDSMNRQQTEYLLDREHTDCLLTGYSAAMRMAVIKRWRELEEQASKPMTQAQLIAASANLLVDMERRQAQTEQTVAGIESRVASVEQVRYLDSMPAGFESMTSIRARINLRHGIPQWVINAVMRDIPGALLPFAMVRSKHADEGGQPYAIWPKADITRRFDRFTAECTFETEQFAIHPDIQQGRFKLRQRASA